ncbi:hypothetical protein FRC10_004700, partial [Ceratobasidium sp. 414]
MDGFGRTTQGVASQRDFLKHARDKIGMTTIVLMRGAWCNRRADHLGDPSGSGITTNIAEAQATVTGDPLRSEWPKLSPVKHNLDAERREQLMFFEELWQWQGGSLPVPWDRLETDGCSGEYGLIDRHRLPAGINRLRNPLQFDDGETMTWAHALRSPDYTGTVEFQFRQPAPGLIFEETQNERLKRSRLTYPPEAMAYSRRQMLENDSARVPWSGLPFGSSAVTELFSDHVKEWAVEVAGGDETMIDLVQFAEEYEGFMPYQATRADFEHAVTRCETLASRLLTPGVEPGRLRADLLLGGFHVEEGSPEHGKIIEWIANNELRHTSGTTMGGEWGVKWIVILILVLWSGAARNSTRDGLRRVADQVQRALGESTQTLTETLEQRRGSSATVGACASLWDMGPIPLRSVPKRDDAWTRKTLIVVKYPPVLRTHGATAIDKMSQKRSHQVMAGTS